MTPATDAPSEGPAYASPFPARTDEQAQASLAEFDRFVRENFQVPDFSGPKLSGPPEDPSLRLHSMVWFSKSFYPLTGHLYAIAVREGLLRDSDEEDQTVSDRIVAHLRHLNPEVSEDALLEALEANNVYRSASLDPARPSHTPSVEGDFEGILDREVVALLLERLRPRERKILYLRFYEGLSQSQIAERIGTSQVHVGRLISSSLAELRTHLDRQSLTSP